jgi:uncharacterized membrane protein YfcA
MSTYALIGLAVLVAAFVQGSTGLGFALISGPVIGMIQPRLLPVFLLIQLIPPCHLPCVDLCREQAS